MSWFGCQHDYIDEGAIYHPPLGKCTLIPRDESQRRFEYGFTEIHQRCTKCGKIQTQAVIGDWNKRVKRSEFDQLSQKVAKLEANAKGE